MALRDNCGFLLHCSRPRWFLLASVRAEEDLHPGYCSGGGYGGPAPWLTEKQMLWGKITVQFVHETGRGHWVSPALGTVKG